jgi:hypothetical protein
MVLTVAICETYVLAMACGCTKNDQGFCGINYRRG